MLTRRNAALAICLVSAGILGYFCVFQGRSPVETFVELWLIWFQVAWWLGGSLGRLLGLKPREIHGEAKRGSLRLTGLALTIECASFVWLISAGVWWLS